MQQQQQHQQQQQQQQQHCLTPIPSMPNSFPHSNSSTHKYESSRHSCTVIHACILSHIRARPPSTTPSIAPTNIGIRVQWKEDASSSDTIYHPPLSSPTLYSTLHIAAARHHASFIPLPHQHCKHPRFTTSIYPLH